MLRQYLVVHDEDGLRRLFKLDPEKTLDGEQRNYLSPSADTEWREAAKDLAARAETDDEALFELVERDPRFLASDLVIARIIEWRIRVVLSRYKGDSAKRFSTNASQAKLDRIGRAIASAGRSGSHGHISMNDLVDAEEAVRARIDEAAELIRGGCQDAAQLADRVGLSDYVVELEELVAKPNAPETVVQQILIAWFDAKSIDEHRTRAHRLGISPRE